MLRKLAHIANALDALGEHTAADHITEVMERIAKKEKSHPPLNKPKRTPGGPKKFTVHVKDKGKVKKVNFGDPNMEIKRDDPERRKNFRARHNCDDPGPKTKPRYWSCKNWEKDKPVAASRQAQALEDGLLDHEQEMHAEMTLEDAINNFDSNMYKVDAHGDWNPEEWMTIEEFVSKLPEGAMDAPASVDANHIAFELPDAGFQVVNMVPREEWEAH